MGARGERTERHRKQLAAAGYADLAEVIDYDATPRPSAFAIFGGLVFYIALFAALIAIDFLLPRYALDARGDVGSRGDINIVFIGVVIANFAAVGLAQWIKRVVRSNLSLHWEWALESKRRPIVYLRRFGLDEARGEAFVNTVDIRSIAKMEDTLERRLMRGAAPLGPLVCLCATGYTQHGMGIARIFAQPPRWKDAVGALTRRCRAVVLMLDTGGSVGWELLHTLERGVTAFIITPRFNEHDEPALAVPPAPLVKECRRRGVPEADIAKAYYSNQLILLDGARVVSANLDYVTVDRQMKALMGRLNLKAEPASGRQPLTPRIVDAVFSPLVSTIGAAAAAAAIFVGFGFWTFDADRQYSSPEAVWARSAAGRCGFTPDGQGQLSAEMALHCLACPASARASGGDPKACIALVREAGNTPILTAVVQMKMGDYVAAEETLARSANPTAIMALEGISLGYYAKGMALAGLGRNEDAQREINSAAQMTPTIAADFRRYFSLSLHDMRPAPPAQPVDLRGLAAGLVRLQLGDSVRARAACTGGVDARQLPDAALAQFRLCAGLALLQAGDAQAEAEIARALAFDPDVEARFARLFQISRTSVMEREAVKELPDEPRPPVNPMTSIPFR